MTTCYIMDCGRKFDDGDKHLEHDVWQVGYYNEGRWYCSQKHLKQATRRNGWLMFFMAICAMVGLFFLQFLIYPFLDKHYFELASNTWAFYAALAICPLSAWVFYKLEKFG
ncbi:MAG: hypothetical protein H6797_01840 [Candidatus Nomurabacteria bacterium]|nr:MAG: hypothetical protein H6797_01840 [Candidatus Nomurabacteria bacterium]